MQVSVALLHDLAAESFQRISSQIGCSPTAAWSMYARHHELMKVDRVYSAWFHELVTAAAEACLGETSARPEFVETRQKTRAANNGAS
jgi:hypothetical protein